MWFASVLWMSLRAIVEWLAVFDKVKDNVNVGGLTLGWTHLNHMSLNPSKTKYMILTTRQKRELLHSPSAHLSVAGNQQITEVSDHKVLGVTIDNNLTWGPHIRDLCKTTAKKSTNQQKKKKKKAFS